jgi:hypothetical protein
MTAKKEKRRTMIDLHSYLSNLPPVSAPRLAKLLDAGLGQGERGAPLPYLKKKRGPRRGEVRRFADSDARCFPELERLMEKKKLSLSAAALSLAESGKVEGWGTAQSRAKRLVRAYNEKRDNTRKTR